MREFGRSEKVVASALRALAYYADPAITVEFRTRPWGATAMVASRATPENPSDQELLGSN